MTITEFINELQEFKDRVGDLNIYIFEEGHGYSEPYITSIAGDLYHTLDGLFPEINIFREDNIAILLTHNRFNHDDN